MNKDKLIAYFELIDGALQDASVVHVYGSAAFIMLDEPDRTSLDVDIAAPYSRLDEHVFREAALNAGLPVNPDVNTSGDHIEWISALRLCLPKPSPDTDIVLWQGRNMTVKTSSVPALIASKLIRYDAVDRSDVQYLLSQYPVTFFEIKKSVKSLPPAFNRDMVVIENLENLKRDMQIWIGDRQ